VTKFEEAACIEASLFQPVAKKYTAGYCCKEFACKELTAKEKEETMEHLRLLIEVIHGKFRDWGCTLKSGREVSRYKEYMAGDVSTDLFEKYICLKRRRLIIFAELHAGRYLLHPVHGSH
jgi:hypothetical protein